MYAGKPIAEVPPLALEPRGATALLDAIGKTIHETGRRLAALPEAERPERVLFVVISDGQENASTEFSSERILAMTTHQASAYKWEFVYLGANQDAIAEAAKMGIRNAANYVRNGRRHGSSDARAQRGHEQLSRRARLYGRRQLEWGAMFWQALVLGFGFGLYASAVASF